MKIEHIGMVNRTEDEAVRFYQEYLGLEKIRDFVVGQELAMQLFFLSQEIKVLVFGKDDVKIEIFIIPDYTPPSPWVGHSCLYLDRFSELIERSKVSGVTVILGSNKGKTVYFLKDYSGNMIEIKPAQPCCPNPHKPLSKKINHRDTETRRNPKVRILHSSFCILYFLSLLSVSVSLWLI